MIGAGDLARYLHVIDTSGAAVMLQAALRTSNRGRKPKADSIYRLYLLGGLIATDVQGVAHVAGIYRALTTELTRDDQLAVGFLVPGEDGTFTAVPLKRFYYVHDRITDYMNFGDWLKDDWLTKDTPEEAWQVEKQARRKRLDDLVDAMLAPTRLNTGSNFAMDATGTWAWALGKRRASQQEIEAIRDVDPQAAAANQAALDSLIGTGDVVAPTDAGGTADNPPRESAPRGTTTGGAAPTQAAGAERRLRTKRVGSYDPEAGYGVKTGKNGKNQVFYGYQVHVLSATAGTDEGQRRQAPLGTDFFTVTPAHEDVVEPSLRVIDRVLDRGQDIAQLAVDRHYSYKRFERWRKPLRERGIKPVHDLRADEHGFTDYNGMKLAAAWPHCPNTPDVLATIPKPGLDADEDEMAEFYRRIEERRQYAFQRINGMTPTSGTTRWRCPARGDATVGCRRVAGTVAAAREGGLPIVVTPTVEPGGLPRCCTQQTVSIPEGDHLKLAQDHYWGSVEWHRAWKLRSMIEGLFGNMKNPSIAGMGRGYYRGVGVAHVTLAVLFAATVTNIHLARTWHEKTGLGDPDHPLLAPDPVDHGVMRLTAEAAALLDEDAMRRLTANRENAA